MMPVNNAVTQRVELFKDPMLNPINRVNTSDTEIVNQTIPTEVEISNESSNAPMVEASTNPEFASAMARAAAFQPDTMYMDLNMAPPTQDSAEWLDWSQQYNDFNAQAAVVTEQRIGMYNQMKEDGASDYEIFQAITNFNSELPMDYQAKAGMATIDVMV